MKPLFGADATLGAGDGENPARLFPAQEPLNLNSNFIEFLILNFPDFLISNFKFPQFYFIFFTIKSASLSLIFPSRGRREFVLQPCAGKNKIAQHLGWVLISFSVHAWIPVSAALGPAGSNPAQLSSAFSLPKMKFSFMQWPASSF